MLLFIAFILLVATIVLLFLGLYRSSPRFAVEKRIDGIKAGENQTVEEELSKPFIQRVVLPCGEGLARRLRRCTPAEVTERTQKKLLMAGLYPRVTAPQMLGLCWFSSFGFFALTLLLLLSRAGRPGLGGFFSNPFNLLYLAIGVVGGFIFPQFVLSKRARARQETILLALPYAIDILSISVEAGMGFDAGVGYTMRKLKGPLAEEFAKTLNEIRLGKPRLEALEDLGNRTGVEELKTFITAVVHASRLGGSITNTLRIQADSMRVRRRQRAQEQAMKAPVKIIFPLVFFIFPALFVVILGPAIPSLKQLFE